MALEIERTSNTKLIKFYVQDKLTFKLQGDRRKYSGIITELNDSSFVINNKVIISYKYIGKVIVDNSNHLTRAASAFLIGCGAGYMALDAINNAINGNKPILRLIDIEIGVGLVVIGGAIKYFSLKRYKINKKHRIKFIDDTP